ncbi:MAG: hypothetical protein J1F07_06675 [Muribaculaceae bacterium]|nr:hypothetical protein [Muribaculaceae bacterium]
MNKYLKLLFVALFATMTFAFTACGDDDDEPDGNNNSSSQKENILTINGVDYEVEFSGNHFFWVVVNEHFGFDGDFIVNKVGDIFHNDEFGIQISYFDEIKTGTIIYPNSKGPSLAAFFNNACQDIAYNLSSGSIEIVSFDEANNRLVIKFNEATYTCIVNCEKGGPYPLKINGTIAFTFYD